MEIATTILGALLVLSLLAHVFLWEIRNDLERRLEEALEQRDRARDERDERTDTFFKRLKQLVRLVPELEQYTTRVGLFDRDVVLDRRAIDRDIEALETAEGMKRAAELRPSEPHGMVFKDCHWGFDGSHDGPIGVFYFETEAVKEARAVPLPLFFVSRTLVPGSKQKTRFGLATVVGPKAGALEGLRGTIVLSIGWDWTLTPKQSARAYLALRRNRAKGARVVWPSGNEVAL